MGDKILLVVGESGSGKTVVAGAMEKLYKLKRVVSYTTRPPRFEGEESYVFLNEHVFHSMPDMCAVTQFKGHYYGVSADTVNRSDIYVLDPSGVDYFKKDYPGPKTPVVVYIDTPEELRRQRMLARGDSEESIQARIEHDRTVFAGAKEKADGVVLNDSSKTVSVVASEILKMSGLLEPLEQSNEKQNLTQTELRIQGALKNIEKTQRTIERQHKLLEKKRTVCLNLGFDPVEVDISRFQNSYSHEEYWAYCDYKHVAEDIESNIKKRAELKEKLHDYRIKQAEEEKKNDVPIVPAVEEFLANWKAEAEGWLREQVIAMKDFIDEITETRKAIRKKYISNEFQSRKEIAAEEKAARVDYSSAKQRIAATFTNDVRSLYEHRGLGFEARLEKELSNEVIRKRVDLFRRCSAVVGVITDASHLYVGEDLNLNGVVIGEKGKAYVRTIGAGGYNIQQFHYRVLVNEIKEKAPLDVVISSCEDVSKNNDPAVVKTEVGFER